MLRLSVVAVAVALGGCSVFLGGDDNGAPGADASVSRDAAIDGSSVAPVARVVDSDTTTTDAVITLSPTGVEAESALILLVGTSFGASPAVTVGGNLVAPDIATVGANLRGQLYELTGNPAASLEIIPDAASSAVVAVVLEIFDFSAGVDVEAPSEVRAGRGCDSVMFADAEDLALALVTARGGAVDLAATDAVTQMTSLGAGDLNGVSVLVMAALNRDELEFSCDVATIDHLTAVRLTLP